MQYPFYTKFIRKDINNERKRITRQENAVFDGGMGSMLQKNGMGAG